MLVVLSIFLLSSFVVSASAKEMAKAMAPVPGMVNKSTYKILKQYLEEVKSSDDDYLFKSKKGTNQPLTVGTVNGMVKSWCRSIKIKTNMGSHSLRKTWGYQQRTRFGVSCEILCKRYNHSSPSVTMRYLGIENKEVNGILMNEI